MVAIPRVKATPYTPPQSSNMNSVEHLWDKIGRSSKNVHTLNSN